MFEYIELRYDTNLVRLISMGCYVLRSFISSSVYILGPSTALSLILGVETYVSILICISIGTFYTCLGGIKAVVWTDLFQAMIMLLFIGILLGKGIAEAGGVAEIIKVSDRDGRINFFNFSIDPTTRQTFWSMLANSLASSSNFQF
jgi:Na+/proline symporter